ncbi:hypothetical protein MLD38_030276 [Melastoma candidum]|uniref:Uncharacterized protein n=1 Tax=Melastoma candidum TaxID=119954 RepID=A0ACB9MKR5_9MYRT|nr:hypothetical protein MLD38_030276 [Melastoma candidum]
MLLHLFPFHSWKKMKMFNQTDFILCTLRENHRWHFRLAYLFFPVFYNVQNKTFPLLQLGLLYYRISTNGTFLPLRTIMPPGSCSEFKIRITVIRDLEFIQPY